MGNPKFDNTNPNNVKFTLGWLIKNINLLIKKIKNIESSPSAGTLDQTLANGNTSNRDITLGGYQTPASFSSFVSGLFGFFNRTTLSPGGVIFQTNISKTTLVAEETISEESEVTLTLPFKTGRIATEPTVYGLSVVLTNVNGAPENSGYYWNAGIDGLDNFPEGTGEFQIYFMDVLTGPSNIIDLQIGDIIEDASLDMTLKIVSDPEGGEGAKKYVKEAGTVTEIKNWNPNFNYFKGALAYDTDTELTYRALQNIGQVGTHSAPNEEPENWKLAEPGIDAYYLSEVLTNKHWIDDKPIYRRVLPFTFNVNGFIQFDLTGYDIDTPISNNAILNSTSGKITEFNSNYMAGTPALVHYFESRFYDDGGLFIYVGHRIVNLAAGTQTTSQGNRTGHLILEYTKTTD